MTTWPRLELRPDGIFLDGEKQEHVVSLSLELLPSGSEDFPLAKVHMEVWAHVEGAVLAPQLHVEERNA